MLKFNHFIITNKKNINFFTIKKLEAKTLPQIKNRQHYFRNDTKNICSPCSKYFDRPWARDEIVHLMFKILALKQEKI